MGCSASIEHSEARSRATRSKSTSEIDEKETSKKGVAEEIKNKKEKIFKKLNQAIDRIKLIQKAADFRKENGDWNDDLKTSIDVFLKTFNNIQRIDSLPDEFIQQYCMVAGKRLSESKSTSVMCKMIIDSWQRGYKDENGQVVAHQYDAVSKALSNLNNFSDCTREVTYDIVNEPNFLETINRILIAIFAANLKGEAQGEDVSIMFSCLCLYDNLSKVDQNISRLRSLEIVPILSFFLHAEEEIHRMVALSCLANIIDENESAILQDKRDVVKFLMKILTSAVKNPHHTCSYKIPVFLSEQGFLRQTSLSLSAQECALTVRRLGRHDANKILLVELGFLPLLAELARNGNDAEQREAVGAIWVLSFETKNHSKIVDDKELMIIDLLIELQKSPDNEVRKAADGTLWVLREKLQNNDKYKHIASQLSKISGGLVQDKKGHIMISYNWSHQKELVAIRDSLQKQGYVVWMDIDNMYGSTLQAMAQAVELAHVVLICISQKYKDSPNCRAEAEYAHKRQKIIIPLKMEEKYEPDGWLGILVGLNLFYEFSGKYDFQAKIKELIRAITISYGNKDLQPK